MDGSQETNFLAITIYVYDAWERLEDVWQCYLNNIILRQTSRCTGAWTWCLARRQAKLYL